MRKSEYEEKFKQRLVRTCREMMIKVEKCIILKKLLKMCVCVSTRIREEKRRRSEWWNYEIRKVG